MYIEKFIWRYWNIENRKTCMCVYIHMYAHVNMYVCMYVCMYESNNHLIRRWARRGRVRRGRREAVLQHSLSCALRQTRHGPDTTQYGKA